MKTIVTILLYAFLATVQSICAMEHYHLFSASDLNKTVSREGQSLKQAFVMLSKAQFLLDCIKKTCFVGLELPDSLGHLDPHVGDTCCETRALMFASIEKLKPSKDQLSLLYETASKMSADIGQLKEELESILPHGAKAQKYTLAMLLEQRGIKHFIDIEQGMAHEFMNLKEALLLTLAKESFFNFKDTTFSVQSFDSAKIDFNYPNAEFGLTAKQFKSMVEEAQKALAKASVTYMQQQLKELTVSGILKADVLSELELAIGPQGCCVNTSGRNSIAYFPLLITLYSQCIQKGIPLLLKVKRFSKFQPVFYKVVILYVPVQGTFQPQSVYNHENKSVLVLDALSFDGSYNDLEERVKKYGKIYEVIEQTEDIKEYKHKLLHSDLLKLLWADASMHPQFSHNKEIDITKKNCVFDNNEKLPLLTSFMRELQGYAQSSGVCMKAMHLFYIKHIYADTIKNQLLLLGESNG